MRLQAVDMSESGVGVVVQGEDASRIMDVLSQIAADIQRIHTPLDVEIELPMEYEVITSWKEIPIRLKLGVRWVSPQERFVSFDFTGCKFKHVYSDQNPVYIKIGELLWLLYSLAVLYQRQDEGLGNSLVP